MNITIYSIYHNIISILLPPTNINHPLLILPSPSPHPTPTWWPLDLRLRLRLRLRLGGGGLGRRHQAPELRRGQRQGGLLQLELGGTQGAQGTKLLHQGLGAQGTWQLRVEAKRQQKGRGFNIKRQANLEIGDS